MIKQKKKSAWNKSNNEEFVNKLFSKNEWFQKGEFTLYGEYENAVTPIEVITKYGLCKSTPNSLLSGTSPCMVWSAVDKDDFIRQELEENNKYYREDYFTIEASYKSAKGGLLVKTPYGLCNPSYGSLRDGTKPTIMTALDKTKYWLNLAREKNSKFEDFSYDKVDYKSSNKKVIITCKKHGDFKIRPSNFISKDQGCPKCVDRSDISKNNGGWYYGDWQDKAEKSKNFDSYKVYIIKCWNEDEEFYKVGRTFLTVGQRFRVKFWMPYNYEIIKIIESENPRYICELEDKLKRENKGLKYIPNISFHGKNECFSKINLDIT